MRWSLILLLLAAASTQAAQVYKCTDANGKLTFSQYPCGTEEKTEQVEVKNDSSGIELIGSGDFSKVDADNAARTKTRNLDRAIATRQANIRTLNRQRDRKIAALRGEQGNARNNAAGAAYHGSLATEVQTVTQDYRARIQREEDAIARLREQY